MLRYSGRWMPAFAVIAAATVAMADEPSAAELKAQIDALQRKVEQLEARQVKGADVDATLQRVLEDAEKRSKLLQSEGFTAGYDKGKFTLRSADGNFVMTPTGQLQFRYIGSGVEGDGYDDGFEVRRAKFGFAGNMVSPELTYKFQWATSRNGGGVVAEDLWVRYAISPEFAIFGGQFEDLTNHESLVSSARQLAVESSLPNRALSEGISEYVQGVGAAYQKGKLRLMAAYHDGAASGNTSYADHTLGGRTVYWGSSGRAELMVLGDNWKLYEDFSARGNKEDLLVLGAGAHYSDLSDGELLLWSVDAQWEPISVPGLGLFASILGSETGNDAAADVSNWGFSLQAGYMLNSKWEVFARYGQIDFEQTYGMVREYTAGVNYYINGHAAKITADVVFLPEGSPSDSGSGIRQVTSNEDQVVGRVQFQLLL